MKKKIGKMRGVLLLTFALFLTACGTGGADAQSASYGNSQAAVVEKQSGSGENESTAGGSQDPVSATLDNIPVYSGTPYVVIDDNEPDFTEDELTDQSYESYSDLDELGRCGVAESNIGTDLMPTGKRGKIGQVKPSGWQTIKFDNVDGKYLYIPRKNENQKAWGENSGIRKSLNARNTEIFKKYKDGTSINTLAKEYFLSEKSIRRIISDKKKLCS